MKTFTSTEAAEELQIDVSRVLQLCRSGRLGSQKFGKSWMITAQEIARYRSLGPRASGRLPEKPPEIPTLKTLVDRLKALKDEHKQLESNRLCDDFDMSDYDIDHRENEIFEACFEIASDIVDLHANA